MFVPWVQTCWSGKGYSNKWGLFLTLLLWITQHHPHLSWAVFPHLCCGSDITASPLKHLLRAEDAVLHKLWAHSERHPQPRGDNFTSLRAVLALERGESRKRSVETPLLCIRIYLIQRTGGVSFTATPAVFLSVLWRQSVRTVSELR